MQKNAFSYVLGVAALSLFCACGNAKKDEAPVVNPNQTAEQTAQTPAEQPAAEEANKVALADQAAATENTQVAQAEVPADAKAAEENKVA